MQHLFISNNRIMKPPCLTVIILEFKENWAFDWWTNVNWGVKGQVSLWRNSRKLLFREAESVSGRSPVVWKQMVPSADWGKVCVSSRNTAAMMKLYHTVLFFARISELCIKYAAL